MALSPKTILPTSGRRHYGDDSITRHEEAELLRYQQQLELAAQQGGVTTAQSMGLSTHKALPSPRTTIPNSILAHYTDETTAEERAAKRKAANALSSRDDAAARALQSKLLEDKIHGERLAQIDIQRQIKEEEARKSRELDAMMNANAAAALRIAKEQQAAKRQHAKDVGGFQIQTAEQMRQLKQEQLDQERALDKAEADMLAEQNQREMALKKSYNRQIALADQRLWDHQKALQAVKNSPLKSLSPRENLQRHRENDQSMIEEREAYQQLRDARALDEQRQQEDKVFKQLALISASAEGTVKMTTPRQRTRLEAINAMGGSTGMIERLDAGDKQRAVRTDVLKRADAQHQEEVMRTGSPRKPIQNGFHSWATTGNQLASSYRAEGEARAFEQGPTMVEKLAMAGDVDSARRKKEGYHVQDIQRLQADQRKLEGDVAKGYDRSQRMKEDMERKEQDDALKRHLEGMLRGHGVVAGSPKAARLKPIDSPRRNPGPGAYGNYESRASPLRK